MEAFGKEGILARLRQLDNDLLSVIDEDVKVEITIVGGSALLLLGLAQESRMTTDIDVMEAAYQAEAIMERYDMNQHVETFLYTLPERWRERRQKIPFNGAILDVYAPSNEDFAILKLYANRDIDRIDLDEMLISGHLDIDWLLAIVNDDVEVRVNFEDDEKWQQFPGLVYALASREMPTGEMQ